jgi:hypothetical protein
MREPEDQAREKINGLLTDYGWIIQNRSPINVTLAA